MLSVRAAFAVGWVLWFAHIAAGLLYALGFGSYAVEGMTGIWQAVRGQPPAWLSSHRISLILAGAAAAFYTRSLISRGKEASHATNFAKVAIFAVLIGGGLFAIIADGEVKITPQITPFSPFGFAGLLSAMGFTFIALQGFDLIAAIGGEVKTPSKTIPLAMLLSLSLALMIYLPLLFVVVVVGAPAGESVRQLCVVEPATCFAKAGRNYLGEVGYWFVIIAAIFSTLTALFANLLAASRIGLSMARDRTVPRVFGRLHTDYRTPVASLLLGLIAIMLLLVVVPSLASAGAAASLIFLIAFTFVHGISVLARLRGAIHSGSFCTPFFPLVPVIGGLTCLGLAIFQGVTAPAAGLIVCGWLCIGGMLYYASFSSRAEAVDAYVEARDPGLSRLRGHSPFVLVPITNPANASSLIDVAHALASREVGQVLLLKVVLAAAREDRDKISHEVRNANEVLREALMRSLSSKGRCAEALLTVSNDPWSEIARVTRAHDCETLVLGLGEAPGALVPLEQLFRVIDSDLALLRAPANWSLDDVKKVLVPVQGRGDHDTLRARVLGALVRKGVKEVTLLRLLPMSASEAACREAEHELHIRAQDEASGYAFPKVARTDNVAVTIVELAQDYDLVITGLALGKRSGPEFGTVVTKIAQCVSCATLIIGRQR